jgi:hypothetical protein
MYWHERACKQVGHLKVCRRATFARFGQDIRNHGCIVFISLRVEPDEHLGDLGVAQSGCSLRSHNISMQPIVLIGN